MYRNFRIVLLIVLAVTIANAQSGEATEPAKKANARTTTTTSVAEPFDGATVEKMASAAQIRLNCMTDLMRVAGGSLRMDEPGAVEGSVIHVPQRVQ